VKRLFVRQALELCEACSSLLGLQHWTVQWARLLLVDFALSRLTYGVCGSKRLGLLLLELIQELWQWLGSLGLSHDPSCFLLTRAMDALRLVGFDRDQRLRQEVAQLQVLTESCMKQVDILPLRPLIIDGSISFQ
ncbi:unnamed protein product, partial [Effrenium voratum]